MLSYDQRGICFFHFFCSVEKCLIPVWINLQVVTCLLWFMTVSFSLVIYLMWFYGIKLLLMGMIFYNLVGCRFCSTHQAHLISYKWQICTPPHHELWFYGCYGDTYLIIKTLFTCVNDFLSHWNLWDKYFLLKFTEEENQLILLIGI